MCGDLFKLYMNMIVSTELSTQILTLKTSSGSFYLVI